jgi:hypothetical protein
MLQEQSTIEFLTSKVKQLELDIQYELHQKNEIQKKYDYFRNEITLKLNELLEFLKINLI